MEQLIELLQQIQELAGMGIDALEKVSGGQTGDDQGGQDTNPADDQGGAAPTAPSGPPPA